jgi:hypothetical protein
LKSRTTGLIVLAVVPAALVGGLLWWLTGFVPECSNMVVSRLDSPDASRSLVVFTRDCGADGLNTQAVIMPSGGTLEGDATAFLALEDRHDLNARWDAYGNLEVAIPEGAVVVQREDDAAGIAIIYN